MATLQELERAFIAADDAGNTEDASAFAAEIQRLRKPKYNITPEFQKKSAASMWRAENPKLAAVADVAGGMSDITRGALNKLPFTDNLGNRLFPQEVTGDTGYRIAGQIADPAALAVSGGAIGAAQAIPRLGMLAKTSVGSAGAGGLLSGLGAEEDVNQAAMTGTVIGAAVPSAIKGASKAVSFLGRPIVENLSKSAREKRIGRIGIEAADNPQEQEAILKALEGTPNGIISRQSAGQAALSAQSPGFSALQSIVDRYRSAPSAALAEEQAKNRAKAIQKISRDAPDVVGKEFAVEAAYINAREKAANRIFGDAYSADDIRVDNLRKSMEKMRGGIAQGSSIELPIPEKVKHLQNDEVISQVVDSVRRQYPEIGNPLSSLRGMEYIRKALSSDISAASKSQNTALKNVNISRLGQAKDEVTKAMSDLSPKFAKGLEEYSKRSLPINQMKVGRVLSEALAGTMGAGEKSTQFANKVNTAAAIIKRTTGQERYDKLSKLFTKEQMGIVKNVMSELSTDAQLEKLALKGLSEQANKMGATLTSEGLPNILNRNVTIANSALQRILKRNVEMTISEMADVMNNPKLMAELMRKANADERKALTTLKRLQTVGVAMSTIPQREQQ